MKQVPLTQGEFALVDDGDFESVMCYKWQYTKEGYAKRGIWVKQKEKRGYTRTQRMHQFIFGDVPDGLEIDHINGNKLDNRRCNLRLATRQEQNRNKFIKKHTTGRYKGVFRHIVFYKGKSYESWRAQISVNRKPLHLGLFKTQEEAALAYNEKAKELFGDYAKLNTIGGELL